MFPASDYAEAMAELEVTLRPWTSSPGLDVLEAGGGSLNHVRFHLKPRVTVLDNSPEQLARNTYADEKVLGDLHTHDFGSDSFDMIVCWNVIEHLEHPTTVLRSFARWLRPGGALVLAAPNPTSLIGLVTKYTPHWFHVWTLRHLFRYADAGRPGFGPFPTFMDRAMYPDALERELTAHSMDVIHRRTFVSDRIDSLRRSRPAVAALFATGLAAARLLTVDRWHPEQSDFHMVAKKQA